MYTNHNYQTDISPHYTILKLSLIDPSDFFDLYIKIMKFRTKFSF